jgi:hypothetical protein
LHDSGSSAEFGGAGGPEQSVPAERGATEQIGTVTTVTFASPVYQASDVNAALWCCEILSDVAQRRQSLQSLREADPELETIVHPYCIVVSQDCDLEQDFQIRQAGGTPTPALPNVLLCEVSSATDLKGAVPAGRDIWKRIIQNKDERYQFLQAVDPAQDAAEQGLPDLGIDFRRYFTVPSDELHEQLTLGARRRCRLISPYKEHFMSRFTHFMARVGLPTDH